MGKRQASEDQSYYTVAEVAAALHVSRTTALQLIDSGELPAIDVSPTSKYRMRRVSRQDLERFRVRRGLDNHGD